MLKSAFSESKPEILGQSVKPSKQEVIMKLMQAMMSKEDQEYLKLKDRNVVQDPDEDQTKIIDEVMK